MRLPNPQDMLEEIVTRLVATAQPRKIILFGSFARGDTHADSDLDILVIESEVVSKYRESIRLRMALRGILVPMDILVVSEAEFEDRSKIPSTLHFFARTEGKVLYDAA
ncbi:nucleotidyltransferase domain-containing protein [Bdellovibrionota bacterium FG-1]